MFFNWFVYIDRSINVRLNDTEVCSCAMPSMSASASSSRRLLNRSAWIKIYIFAGSSEHDAHVLSNIGYFVCWRQLITSRAEVQSDFFKTTIWFIRHTDHCTIIWLVSISERAPFSFTSNLFLVKIHQIYRNLPQLYFAWPCERGWDGCAGSYCPAATASAPAAQRPAVKVLYNANNHPYPVYGAPV